MKTILLMGSTGCGKTTLTQKLNGEQLIYQKTQTIQVSASVIDTPGEYLENRGMYKALVVTAVDAELLVFVQDAADERFRFSPGQASMFASPVIGVVTKLDCATPQQAAQAEELLRLAGAEEIFLVSAVTGEGMKALAEFLEA